MLSDPSRSPLEERILADFAALVAVNAAYQLGLVARLARGPVMTADMPSLDNSYWESLATFGIVERDDQDGWRMSANVGKTLTSPSVEARIRFTAMAAADALAGGGAMFADTGGFVRQARTFSFFNYDRAAGDTASAVEDVSPWVRYVTALSELEAPQLAPHIPLEGRTRLLEIGGNTGAFALALLDRHPELSATILDLPAVCVLGEAYIRGRDAGDRLDFVRGDARRDPLPPVRQERPDVILFKSVLHDWPPETAGVLLKKALDHLRPGGEVLICERAPLQPDHFVDGLPQAPNMVFSQFYRTAGWYAEQLAAFGCTLREPVNVPVDSGFFVLSAETAGGGGDDN